MKTPIKQKRQPTLDFNAGKKRRDAGIKRAVKHANDLYSNWSEQAYILLTYYIERNSKPFQTEDFRAEIKGLIVEPPTNRAFGGIIRRAAFAGLIRKVGTDSVNNPNAHCAISTVWQRV